MSLAFFVGVAPKATRFFLRLLHYLKQLPRVGFTSVVTLSGLVVVRIAIIPIVQYALTLY